MRQNLVVTAMALALSASAWSAPIPSGTYTGTSTALSPSADGKAFTVEVSQEDGHTVARVISLKPGENYYEEWVWDDTTLTVKQHTFVPGYQRPDHQIHQEVSQYRATINGGNYHIECTDRASNNCDMGLDSRCFWTIAATADGFTCEAWGPADRNQAGKPVKLQTLTFTCVK